MIRLLDKYFANALLWDYLISSFLALLTYILYVKNFIDIPSFELIDSTSSDIGNISFTSAGFVLTFLTLLISFRAGIDETEIDPKEKQNLFQVFLNSGYYDQTIKHLKNAIKSLIFIALTSYSLKLFLVGIHSYHKHWFNIFGIFTIAFTLIRCLLVLSKILGLQKNTIK